ncbi:MAG TPA: cysteine peptidase family C39 domain-containing protein [Anaerolineae bacterium]|nr:cysteine peptidase family C39 domain-containing protein [Anaerolineae bacterium]
MNPFPFFSQERPESCVPACLRMVLAYYGLQHTEAEIYTCCETDVDGTLPSAAVRCAQHLGFNASAPRLPGLDALKEHLRAGQIFPIVYLNLSPVLGVNVIHAMIVENIDVQADQVQVIDPAYPPSGQRTIPLGLFEVGWRLVQNQTILVIPAL